MPVEEASKERLQKILARAGYGSRRACEELIVEGRVTINDQTVSVLGVRADPMRDAIAVDGERLRLPKSAYWILHKREGQAFTDVDDEDTFKKLIPGDNGRLFSVGRLDRGSRGLMVITNDGRVANLLTHPRYKVPKVYKLVVEGSVGRDALRNLERAMYYAFNGGRFEPFNVVKRSAASSVMMLSVYAGLPAALREIFLKFGHPLKSITRERIGCVQLGDLPPGEVRKLRGDETRVLFSYAEDAENSRLDYEHETVSPSRFTRDNKTTGFHRKKTGARTTSSGGQKAATARAKPGLKGPGGLNRSKARPGLKRQGKEPGGIKRRTSGPKGPGGFKRGKPPRRGET
jgi:23S rRNA pseudouridine2605 synthase